MRHSDTIKIAGRMKDALKWLILLTITGFTASAQQWTGKFEQLNELLPTPNSYRTGSGAPGENYWQQRADYVISAELEQQDRVECSAKGQKPQKHELWPTACSEC